jgi:chemotaxis protein MotA
MSTSGIIGIITAFAMVILAALADGDQISALFSATAVLIVFGGTFAALITQFGFPALLRGLKYCSWMIRPPKIDLRSFIDQAAVWANQARSQGTLSLESALGEVTDPFQRKGLQMIIDNASAEELESTLGALAGNASRDEEVAGAMWETAGGYAPTIGVMGAVLGLIHVMLRLDHPSELGDGIATAFVATIYGVGSANLLFLPLGARLSAVGEQLERERYLVIQGFLLITEGKSGMQIRQILRSFLAEEKAKEKKAAAVEELANEPAVEAG